MDQIIRFLNTGFPGANSIQPIGAGMFAQAYGFTVDGRDYVLRINPFEEDFAKDEYACVHFASSVLPIPRMVARGRFDDTRFFAVTERCPGVTMHKLSDDEQRALTPDLFARLDAVHALDATPYTGWGLTDAGFNGRFSSWDIYQQDFFNQKFNYDWPGLFAEGILEKQLFRELEAEMLGRLLYCRDYRAVVHGDYAFDNVVCLDGCVTGVLDWAEARLGDPLYDVAWMDFFGRLPLGDLWREWAGERNVPDFEERMICYLLNIGLGSLAVAAHLRDERDYRRVRDRTLSIFSPGRRRATDWSEEEK